MKTIKKLFNEIQNKNPHWSSLVCFNMAIVDRKFTKEKTHRWFNKLVVKEDYKGSIKRRVVSHTMSLLK